MLALVVGPRPADKALRTLDAALPENPHPPDQLLRAVLLAMLGRFDEAWPLAREANDRLRAFRAASKKHGWQRSPCWTATTRPPSVTSAGRATNSPRAVACPTSFDCAGARASALHAGALRRGRAADAPRARTGERERRLGAGALAAGQALVEAASGKDAEAERLAHEAVAIVERTDGLNLQGDALCDLAEVLHAGGRTDEAAGTLEQALERYKRKQNLAMVAQVRPRLERLLAESEPPMPARQAS